MQTSFNGQLSTPFSSHKTIIYTLTFQLHRQIPYGQAVFVSGNISQLGLWTPQKALRLNWTENNWWRGSVQIRKGEINSPIQFKFITSHWQIQQNDIIQWEQGTQNRIIQIGSHPILPPYTSQWNKQNIMLCLHSSHLHQKVGLFASGSSYALGQWKFYQQLQPINKEVHELLTEYFKDEHQFESINLSSLYFYSFSIELGTNQVNYAYSRRKQIYEPENFVGRMITLRQNRLSEGRIKEGDWAGIHFVIDQPAFDNIRVQRLNTQIYIAVDILNSNDVNQLKDHNITAIFNIGTQNQSDKITDYHLRSLFQSRGLIYLQWIVKDCAMETFACDVGLIVAKIQQLIEKGHRVCIHCSRSIIKSLPLKMLYLTLLQGYPFDQAIQVVKHQLGVPDSQYKAAQDVFYLVNSRISRGKIQIKTH